MAKTTPPADAPAESQPDVFSGQGGSYRITETGDRIRVEWTDPEPQTVGAPLVGAL